MKEVQEDIELNYIKRKINKYRKTSETPWNLGFLCDKSVLVNLGDKEWLTKN